MLGEPQHREDSGTIHMKYFALEKIVSTFVTTLAVIVSAAPTAAQEERPLSFQPEFFANRAGVEFDSSEEEGSVLKKLGFAGLSQDTALGDELAERVAGHRNAGSRIVSLYWKVNDTEKPLTTEQLEPLRNSNAIIEVSVWKLRAKTLDAIRRTADTAARMNIRLAIYPHKGHEIDTMASALNLMNKVDHPNVGVMFVLCQFLRVEEADTLENVLENSAPHLYAVSTSGGDVDSEDWGKLIQPLNKGSFSQMRLFRALKELDYRGPVFLQAWWGVNDREQKLANLESSIMAWREVLHDLDSTK